MLKNPKQENFCVEFSKSGNATAAYVAAYGGNSESARSKASHLLQNVAVQERLQEIRSEVASKAICDCEEIQRRLSEIARRETVEEVFLPNGDLVQKKTSVKDSLKAIEILAKIHGMFVSKSEIDLRGNVPIVIVDDI